MNYSSDDLSLRSGHIVVTQLWWPQAWWAPTGRAWEDFSWWDASA